MFSEEQVINVEFLPNDIVDGATYIIKQSNPNSYTHGMFKYHANLFRKYQDGGG